MSRIWTKYLIFGLAAALATMGRASAFIAYVSNEKGNTVSVIDTDSFTVTDTIKVGQRPRGIEFTRDGKFVMVAVGDDDTIQLIDAEKKQVVDTLPSGPDPELFIQDSAGKILYVANENDNTVTVIDLEKRARIGDIQVGVEPEGMALSPDGKILINTSETTSMAHFIDTMTRQIVANVLVGSRPRFAEFKRDGSELWISSEIGNSEPSRLNSAKRGREPTRTLATIWRVIVSMKCAMLVVSEVLIRIFPSGLSAMPSGSTPTWMSPILARFSRSITVTVLSFSFAT